MFPLRSVEEDLKGAVAPKTNVLATLTVRALEATLGKPLINGFHAETE
jgi:hypothetical protein